MPSLELPRPYNLGGDPDAAQTTLREVDLVPAERRVDGRKKALDEQMRIDRASRWTGVAERLDVTAMNRKSPQNPSLLHAEIEVGEDYGRPSRNRLQAGSFN